MHVTSNDLSCRYLQQLVSAQATRNRDLEQQLQSFRGPSSAGASVNGMDTMLASAGTSLLATTLKPDATDGRVHACL